jgi:chemotaxis protein CheD
VILESGVVEQVYLHPGQVCLCEQPSMVETVLGSCVAVTLWNPRLQVSCICHAVMPFGGACGKEPLKYVDSSIRHMLELLWARSSRRQELEVKVFGGASMRGVAPGRTSVGQQNVDAALATLAKEGFTPRICETGGTSGRKLIFHSATGDVFVKRISVGAGE